MYKRQVFVKIAVKNVINEGSIGLCLTALMILLFLGNLRATISVLLSIPISCLAAFIALNLGASTIKDVYKRQNDSLAGLIVTFFSGICLEQNLGPDRARITKKIDAFMHLIRAI